MPKTGQQTCPIRASAGATNPQTYASSVPVQRPTPGKRTQAIAFFLLAAAAFFGKLISSIPSAYSAVVATSSTACGNAKARYCLPKRRSRRTTWSPCYCRFSFFDSALIDTSSPLTETSIFSLLKPGSSARTR